jgi:ribosomal protein L11 methyltransferase
VLAELIELAPGGVEEVDVDDGLVEYAIYGAPGELPSLPALTAAAGDALVEVRTEEVADDWQERWRAFHRPLVLGSSLAVRPPWEAPAGTSIDIVIDPGQAFGTGSHATTRLCLESMLELTPRSGPFVDLGCGSGVLAIAAARLGWQPVLALDNDPAAVQAAAENAQRNRVQLDVRRYDLRVDAVEASVAATVAANLLAPLLKDWARRLTAAAAVPERVICGGVLAHEGDEVAATFAQSGLREVRRCRAGDWISLLLERMPAPC